MGGAARKHVVEIRASTEGTWQRVASGAWRERRGVATFEPRAARHLRLTILDTHPLQGKDVGFVAIADVDIWTVEKPPAITPKGGRWSETLDFPLVPVTAWFNPKKGRLVTLASYTHNNYDERQTVKQTVLAEWDPLSGAITEQVISKTEHDVFCPGTSTDERGRVIFTGGSAPGIYSIWDPDKGWIKPTPNTIVKPRGYQGQTYLPDGRTFMIGGQWSGGGEDKDGEVYEPGTGTGTGTETGKWTLLNDTIKAKYIKMDPGKCNSASEKADGCVNTGWQQHHPWLFAWKSGTVFHAGPSKQMNWFKLTKGHENRMDGGVRGSDGDAVGGCAVMYDAVKGHILTAGGAPNYHYWVDADHRDRIKAFRFPSTNNAFHITLGEPGKRAEAAKLESMTHNRTFANAAILPTGEILVVGGQLQGEPFLERTWVWTAEIYTPGLKENSWRAATRHSTPRVYHSWALLLPDATVLVGGSGLNSNHDHANHYDAQIYQPHYLLSDDGKSTVPRPKILDDDVITHHELGSVIVIQTDVPVDLDASLIRYSAVTHTVNNDLRRIPVTMSPQGNNKYTVRIPAEDYVALPGYWMLFVLKGGVPSKAKTVRLVKGQGA